jgi:hypothetical protein
MKLQPTRRNVILGLGVSGAVVAAVAATFVSHKASGESRQRKAVSAYIDTVNFLQDQMHIELTKVTLAYRDLAANSMRRKQAPAELAAAAATLTRLDRKLVATPAPPEAKRFRRLLIRLVAQQAALTREVQQLAAFTPRFSVFVERLRAVSTRFNNAMRAIRTPARQAVRGTRAQVAAAERAYRVKRDAAAAAQADAVDAYVGGVAALLDAFHTLNPPAVVAPAYRGEMRSLHDVTVTGAALSAELRTASRAGLAERIRAFTLAGREAETLVVQREQLAAIRAYNRRSRAVGTMTAAVLAELRRLGQTLP